MAEGAGNGGFDFFHFLTLWGVAMGSAAFGWVWRTDRKVAVMENDYKHSTVAHHELKEMMREALKQITEIKDEIARMPRRTNDNHDEAKH